MNLMKKKNLASKTLGVGKGRIVFLKPRIEEIKEAITKQDIRQLHKEGAIKIKSVGGRKKVGKKVGRRGPGKVKQNVNKRKKEYVILTRKFRKHISNLLERGEISKEMAKEVRKKIRNREYRSLSHLKESIKEVKK